RRAVRRPVLPRPPRHQARAALRRQQLRHAHPLDAHPRRRPGPWRGRGGALGDHGREAGHRRRHRPLLPHARVGANRARRARCTTGPVRPLPVRARRLPHRARADEPAPRRLPPAGLPALTRARGPASRHAGHVPNLPFLRPAKGEEPTDDDATPAPSSPSPDPGTRPEPTAAFDPDAALGEHEPAPVGRWGPDVLGDGFTAQTVELLPDEDGPVVTTVVRYRPEDDPEALTVVPPRFVMLHLHGWNDYFHQRELARRCAA